MTARPRVWLLGAGALLVLGVLVLALAPLVSTPGGLVARLFARQDLTWQGMVERGSWRVGLDPSFPPFEMLDESDRPVGFDVDLARQMAATWGLEVEFVPLGFDSLLDALKAGQIDSVISALPYDPRGTRDYAYSAPYFEAGVRLAVRAGAPFTTTAALDGRRVAVEWGSMGDMVGRRLQREGIDLTLVPYETPDDAAAALVDDPAIDALLIDHVSLRSAQGQGAAIVAAGPALENNPYVIASPLRATVLQEQIAAALEELQRNGTLAELEARWFGEIPEPKD